MADAKKFYWLKLKRDFFKRHDIRIIEEMSNGKDYILFYLKMLLESIDHEGELRFSETIPYNEQMLSVITNTNIDIVKAAMKIFIELNMIEILDDSTIYMAEVLKLTGSETAGARRLKEYRKKQKMLQECTNVQKCNIEIEKELEKEKEIELEAEKEKEQKADKPPRTRFKPPTLEEVQAYCQERQNGVDAQRFIDYYTSNGWKVGKNAMKDWKAAVRNWERSDTAKPAPKTDKPETNNPFLKILMEEGDTL